MKYIWIIVLAIVFVGCGSGDSVSSDENPPTSPQTTKSENIPPSVPKI